MKKFLYYPNLEPPNTEWLKFSILYLERFESIVPYGRQHLISDEYRRLSNETDLVEMYSPEYMQGERASIKSIEEAQKFLRDPYGRGPLMNRVNIERSWRNERNWTYQIFSEKFSYRFGEFCESERIGRRNGEGLLLPKELAFLFMTHLAQEISYERDGSIITDNIEFDNYSNFSRVHNSGVRNRNKFMKGIINLLVPANISEIGFDRLIEFRNRNRESITVFNNQINLLEDSIGNGITERDFINSFNNIYSELTREIVLMGIGLASIPFATYMLINNPQALSAEYSKEILGALGIGIGGTYAIKRALFDTREKRLCKKYLTNVERLK
ncbi:hypothetical protein [uncultured Algibacter sp.]|uniref:hypothetical protein n=1 Tax=uncultured Algibacter sp. TaxID=298659 RepID=UPI002634A062|nr:hypothetical protein [uncultured Algibacter sp.]